MEQFEQLIITKLSCEAAVVKAKTLATVGLLQQREDYCYLKVEDDYIHSIHPMLKAYGTIDKPAYFSPPKDVGAHISVIYPEENVRLSPSDVGQRHSFSICGLIKAQYGSREYFALSVISPSLAAFRQDYFLEPKPTFRGQQILFHITVGIRDR